MTDERTETLLNHYVDGELPLDRQGELFSRLADDREARAQFNTLMAFRLATRVDANPVAPAVDEALFARIDQLRAAQPSGRRAEDRQPFRGLRRRVTVGAALAVGVVLVVARLLLPVPVEVAEPVVAAPVSDEGPIYVIYPGLTVEDDSLEGAP